MLHAINFYNLERDFLYILEREMEIEWIYFNYSHFNKIALNFITAFSSLLRMSYHSNSYIQISFISSFSFFALCRPRLKKIINGKIWHGELSPSRQVFYRRTCINKFLESSTTFSRLSSFYDFFLASLVMVEKGPWFSINLPFGCLSWICSFAFVFNVEINLILITRDWRLNSTLSSLSFARSPHRFPPESISQGILIKIHCQQPRSFLCVLKRIGGKLIN